MLATSRFAVAAALCCCMAATVHAQSLPTTEAGGGPTRTTALNGRVFRGLIRPENQSTVTGTISMIPAQEMGMTELVISLVGVEPGTVYWHIHVGECGTHGGALLGDKAQYHPIKVGSDGRATLKETISLPPPSGGNYHVNIHEGSDPNNEGKILACANLYETGV